MSEVLKKSDFGKVERIIEFIEEKGEITSKEAERISGKSAATVRRYLKMLVETGYVEAEGNTNNSRQAPCARYLSSARYYKCRCVFRYDFGVEPKVDLKRFEK